MVAEGVVILVVFSAESKDGFSYDIEQVSYLFAFSGLVGAITQGLLIRPILKVFDERKVFIAGCIIMGIGLGTIPFSNHILVLLFQTMIVSKHIEQPS